MSQQPGPLTIGFDIGGTNLRGAVVNGRGQIIDSAHVPTPDSPKGLEEGISFVVKQLRANYDVDAVGLDICGPVQDTVLPEISARQTASPMFKELMDTGNMGYKTGRGFYDWSQKDMDALVKRRNDFIIHSLKKIREPNK